jgi:hypothetical protein
MILLLVRPGSPAIRLTSVLFVLPAEATPAPTLGLLALICPSRVASGLCAAHSAMLGL